MKRPNAEHLTDLLGEPGQFFAYLYQRLVPHVSDLFSQEWEGRHAPECAVLTDLVVAHPGDGLPRDLADYILGTWTGNATIHERLWRRRAFVVLCAIDDACARIHPGVRSRSPANGAPVRGVLDRMKNDRIVSGCYGRVDGSAVLPKGPLNFLPPDSGEADDSGDRLDTQFSYLSVVPTGSQAHAVQFDVVDSSLTGARVIQQVGIAAVAEDADDITFVACLRTHQPRLHAEPDDRLTQRAAESVACLCEQGADLVVLPELVVAPQAVTAIRDRLASASLAGTPLPSLAVLGSGLSAEKDDDGLAYNECVIVGGWGQILWRQRKLHHFSMCPNSHMRPCGIDPAGEAKHREDTRSGTIMEIRDLPHIGRVVVLICEDLEQPAPGNLLLDIRPDWIITPVLDTGLDEGRWTFRRLNEFARRFPCNAVVATSATLSVRKNNLKTLAEALNKKINIGLLRGSGRRYKLLTAETARPCVAVATWTPATWPQFAIACETPNQEPPPDDRQGDPQAQALA